MQSFSGRKIRGWNCPFIPSLIKLLESNQRNNSVGITASGIIMFQDQFFNLQTEYIGLRFLPVSSKVIILCYWKVLLALNDGLRSC